MTMMPEEDPACTGCMEMDCDGCTAPRDAARRRRRMVVAAGIGVLVWMLVSGCATRPREAVRAPSVRPYPLPVVTNFNGGEMEGPSW